MAGETVKTDITEGSVRVTAENGYEIQRVYRIYGLNGTDYNRLLSAPTITGMPAISSAHPGRAGCLLRDISGQIESNECVKLVLQYSDNAYPTTTGGQTNPPSDSTIQTGATLTQTETNLSYSGNPQYVLCSGKDAQTPLFSKFEPEPAITITRVEYIDPLDKATEYVGKTNHGPPTNRGWNLRPYDLANTWLCAGITGQSSDSGASYQVTYSFIRHLPNWDKIVFWLDPATNRPPKSGVVEGNGQLTVPVYTQIDFNDLSLP